MTTIKIVTLCLTIIQLSAYVALVIISIQNLKSVKRIGKILDEQIKQIPDNVLNDWAKDSRKNVRKFAKKEIARRQSQHP